MKHSIAVFLIISVLMTTRFMIGVVAEDNVNKNIAIGKRYVAANQYSSTYSVDKAFDGNVNSAYSAGYEELEGKLDDSLNYLMVDLGGTYEITTIIVRSRRDMDQPNSRSDWTLEGSIDRDFSEPVLLGMKSAPGAVQSDLEVTLPEGGIYRYVRVSSPNIMVISEFEIYGTMVEISAGYSDIGEDLYNENMLNSYLDLVEPLKNNEFGINSVLTYENACKIILKCLNAYNEEQVSEGFMQKCIDLKLCDEKISEKNKYIKTADFAKMAIKALGFGKLLDNKSPDEYGIKILADGIGLCENIKWENEDYLTRESALRFAYNMMLIRPCELVTISASGENYVQTGETLLEKKFDLIYKEGQVISNSVTTLHEATRADGVVIAGVRYNDVCGDAGSFIGKDVRFLTDRDNNIVTVWENYEKFESVIIKAHDISECSLKEIRALNENGKTVKYKFDNIYSVLKNGVAYNDYTAQTFVPQNGEIELIDSDKNGSYDIIHVWQPQIVICTGASITEEKVSLSQNDGSILIFDQFKVCVTEIDGVNVVPEDFFANKLLYVYASENGAYVRIAASTNAVSGTITEITNNEIIEINNSEFVISDYCLADPDSMSRIKIGNFCTILIDSDGYVVWVERNEDLREEENLGYLIKTAAVLGISPKVEFKIFRQDREFSVYESAEYIMIDGERYSRSQFAELISEDNSFKGAIENSFVVFTLNNIGHISEIDTERETSEDSADSKLKKIADISNFYGAGDMLASGSKMLMPIKGDTPIFIIPTDRNMDEKYNVTTADSRFHSGRTETAQCSFFGADEYGYPYFGAVFVTFNQATVQVGVIDNYSVDFAVVENITITAFDGDEAYRINGYNLSNGNKINFTTTDNTETMIDKRALASEKSEWINNYGGIQDYDNTISKYFISIGNLGKGDIIAYRQSNNQLTAVELVFDADSDARETDYIHRHGQYYSSLPLYCDNLMLFGTYGTFDSVNRKIELSVGTDKYIYSTDNVGGVYYMNINRNYFGKISIEKLFEYVSDGSRMMLYIERGIVKGIYVL